MTIKYIFHQILINVVQIGQKRKEKNISPDH